MTSLIFDIWFAILSGCILGTFPAAKFVTVHCSALILVRMDDSVCTDCAGYDLQSILGEQ